MDIYIILIGILISFVFYKAGLMIGKTRLIYELASSAKKNLNELEFKQYEFLINRLKFRTKNQEVKKSNLEKVK